MVIIFISTAVIQAYGITRGFGPEPYPGNKSYGIGTYFAPDTIKIYAEPDLNSQNLEIIKWKPACIEIKSTTNNLNYPEQVFLVYYPYNNVALMTVTEEKDEWIKVIYDYKNNLSGWIYLKDPVKNLKDNIYTGKYFSWLEFMQTIAKYKGIYYIAGVSEDSKLMKSAPEENAKTIITKFTHVKNLELKLVRGNWLLVKAIDFDNSSPIGWIRWRDDDGQLLIFCNLD